MKRNIFYSIIAVCIALMTVNCSNDLEYKEPQVTAVTQLLSPNKEQSAKLVASATASMFLNGHLLSVQMVMNPFTKCCSIYPMETSLSLYM